MRFGKTLKAAIYQPWKDQYLDYPKLKSLLREDLAQGDQEPWTEDDETKFCDELFSVQLEKVTTFQETTFKKLEQRAGKAGEQLRDLAPEDGRPTGDITKGRFRSIEEELDSITNTLNQLKKYSSINYTGFLKAVKKHDRKRGNRYKVRPLLQISLAKRPFNSEQNYAPLINKLSAMYFVIRQNLDDGSDLKKSSVSDVQSQTQSAGKYTAHKFWIHPDNLLEVKTFIMRRLPILVYSQQSAKTTDASLGDPTITSIYFDNADFLLYNQKVDREADARSLRLRWYGQLAEKPEILLEQKTVQDDGSSEDQRFSIKDKYIEPFIKGDYKMEKSVQKLARQHQPEEKVKELKTTVADIQDLIKDRNLQPMLRVNYTRTAFQKPLDDKVRISIDTNLAFIREDSIDHERPCRNANDWHRMDIDSAKMEYPFSQVNPGELSKFPFAVLEIKVRDDGGRNPPQWCQDLMSSHLVHKTPRFSKFVHGVASLFEDHVNNLPFWLSQVETDIRRDAHAAFQEEELAKAQKAEDDLIVGSYLSHSRRKSVPKNVVSSPFAKSYRSDRTTADSDNVKARSDSDVKGKGRSPQSVDEHGENEGSAPKGYGTVKSSFPSFSLSRYAQLRRQRKAPLPTGVTKPGQLIKDSGPLHVEPKVWLANERTFIKWQHISILLGTLALTLYTAAGEGTVGEVMGIAYIVIAVFAGLWGYYMHTTRRSMIMARSGKDFDNLIGPVIVSFALMIALLLNFIFQYRSITNNVDDHVVVNRTNSGFVYI